MQIAHIITAPRRAAARYLVLALGLAALGCGSGHAARNENDGPVRTTIEVQNEDFNDMAVFVLVNGARTRLGIASGNKSTVLTIPDYLLNGVTFLRFVASPIGGNRSPVSEEVDVTPGDQLAMVIRPGS